MQIDCYIGRTEDMSGALHAHATGQLLAVVQGEPGFAG